MLGVSIASILGSLIRQQPIDDSVKHHTHALTHSHTHTHSLTHALTHTYILWYSLSSSLTFGDLESVEEVLANPASGKEGLAPIYGMAANIPDRNLVGDILVGYMDALYKV